MLKEFRRTDCSFDYEQKPGLAGMTICQSVGKINKNFPVLLGYFRISHLGIKRLIKDLIKKGSVFCMTFCQSVEIINI